MKRRRPPEPVRYEAQPRFERSLAFRRALKELGDENRPARLVGLTGDQKLFARVAYLAAKHNVSRHQLGAALERATNELRQVVVAPERDTPIDDCITAWCMQPEGRALLEAWMPEQIRKKNYAAYEGSKAVMIAAAGIGLVPHFRTVLDVVRKSNEFVDRFTDLAAASPRAEHATTAALKLRGYSSVLRHVRKLSPDLPILAMTTCVDCVKELARLHPDAPIGQYLSIDGDMVAAWTQQHSSRDPSTGKPDEAREDHLRRRAPEAGFRAYTYTDNGAEEVQLNRKLRRQIANRVRGYILLVLSDIVTGLPLVGMLVDSSKLYEPDGLKVLLPLLYELWPDIPLKAIAADKLYDDQEAVRYCAVHHGVALVAVRKPSNKARGGVRFGDPKDAKAEIKHKYLARITGSGQAYCRSHPALPLRFEGNEWPDRLELAPGEPFSRRAVEQHARRFRARWFCQHGCGRSGQGRLSAATQLAWSALPYYPLTPSGRLDLFAMRISLQATRNTSESNFSSLEVGFKQALQGAVRTRLFDKDSVEALIWLAFATRSLTMLADQRGYAHVPVRRVA